MRPLATGLALALAASAASAQPARHHVLEMAGPDCLTASKALFNALTHGGVAGRLDGGEAETLLSAVNAMPPASDLHADAVVVLRPDPAIVALFRACHERDVSLRLDAFAEVWKRARGEGV